MSTLEVGCARCDKRFRVRAEFAGKATRCPGCSAPITIEGPRPAPPREEYGEKPRPRPRPRDDDDRPAHPAGNWRPVDTALGREQLAVLFALLTIVCSFLSYCLLALADGPSGVASAALLLAALLLVGPALVAAIAGVSARISAIAAPAEAVGKAAAVSSLLCAIAGVGSLVLFAGAFLWGIEEQRREPFPQVVAGFGILFSALAAAGTFAAFVAQVGIARRSMEVGRAFGRASAAVAACLLVLLGLCLLIAVAVELLDGRPRDGERGMALFAGILLPVGVAVIMILYYRLLAAARLAVRGESAGV